MTRAKASAQTSMFEAFAAAEFEQKTAHMPGTMDEAASYLLGLFKRLDAAIIAGDGAAVDRLEQEADDLAVRLNGGTNFGMAVDDGAAAVLERKTRAPAGQIPLWGQQGEFVIDLKGMKVRVVMDGVYGVAFPGFAAHAVEWGEPFLSETGYRSFLGYDGHFRAGVSVEGYVRSTIETHIARELKGRLLRIGPEYAARQKEPQP